MSPRSDRFQSGMLFEWAVDLDDARIEVLASVGAAALLRALRRDLLPQLRAEGFQRLRITGTRLSGARPGRTLDINIDLTEDPT